MLLLQSTEKKCYCYDAATVLLLRFYWWNSEMVPADDGESSGHTSYESEDDYMQGILEEADPANIQRSQTRQWDDLSTVPQEGSDASGSNESLADMAGMARIPEGDETSETRFPEGDENDALSSHPSSAEENQNEKPACEANRCRCPRGCYCLGDGDCRFCASCYHERTWCKCDCKGCKAHDLAREAEAAEPTFTRASGDSDGTPPTRDAPARGNAREFWQEQRWSRMTLRIIQRTQYYEHQTHRFRWLQSLLPIRPEAPESGFQRRVQADGSSRWGCKVCAVHGVKGDQSAAAEVPAAPACG